MELSVAWRNSPTRRPADTMLISDKDAIASIFFTSTIQATNLTLANLQGDGAIVPGDAGGQECHHLMRQRGRVSAFLYGRIDPELKKEPFTNALVMVEYFDAPSRDPRNGWISLQYDGRDGVYCSTAQRVKLNGTMKWTHATFVLEAPTFNGSENDGGTSASAWLAPTSPCARSSWRRRAGVASVRAP